MKDAVVRANARGHSTRARLLEAALGAFASRGFHGTSTRDIATAAGMSPAAVYVHYPTKEELLFQIALAGHEDVECVVERALLKGEDNREKLHEVVRAFTIWHAQFHTQARVIQYEMAALRPEHADVIATVRRKIESRVRHLIERGISAGEFQADDPAVTTLAILSLGIDVARWYRDEGPWTPEVLGVRYANLVVRLVQPDQPPAGSSR